MKILYCEQPLGVYDGKAPVTLLTDSSVSRNHRPLFIPPHHDDWIMTIAPAVRVSRLGRFVATKFARRYYDAVTLVARLRPAGLQLPASAVETAFDSSIVIGDWIEPGGMCPDTMTLDLTGDIVSTIELDMKVFDSCLSSLSAYFIVRHGDIIIPGDLPGQLGVALNTAMTIKVDGVPCLVFRIK